MDSRRSADVSYTLRTREEYEEEPYSDELDDESDDDLFDADELGLDPEEDDEYYAATEFFHEHCCQRTRDPAAHRVAV